MQVATLFRESSTLLGATMEAGGGGAAAATGAPDSGVSALPPGPIATYDYNNHPVTFSNKYKLNMKLEPHDDGYETSADMLLSNTASVNHEVKCEKLEDPYSFIDDDPIPMLPAAAQGPPHLVNPMPPLNNQLIPTGPKKRGRKKKIKPEEPGYNQDMNGGIPRPIKERKKHDRFNGMPEEEVSKRTLPDHLTENLDIIIIGINPGLFAAYKGHHYAGPGNHFWKCLYLSGLTQQQVSADEDYKLLQVGIGFTNMVQRATKGSADLTRKEIKEGSQILLEKLRKFRPKIAVFNGKLIYEVFSGKKDFKFGRQPDLVDGTNTYMWVMPSSSARCAQLPRAADKVPFYAALKKFRDYLNGVITEIDESEMVFSEPRVKSCYEAEPKPDPYSTELTDISNAVIKKEDGTIVPCKKKRGRPKKIKVEGEEPPPKPVVRKSPPTNCDFPKKKRGRPKKVKVENMDIPPPENNTSTNMSQCYSHPSPIQSPNFYQMGPALTPPNSSSNLYAPQPQGYAPSPRPHSQPFTHSDLSSEISAAISSEQLGSPASPSLGPPDFEPPTSMAEEAECRLSSPAPSTNSEQTHYPYHYMDSSHEAQYASPRQPQDLASKSLSGLESLVDQIPSITEGETPLSEAPDQYSGQFNNYTSRASPVPYNYPPSGGYPLYPTPTWSGYEPMPLAYPQLPYAQGYGPGLHMPSPNYPYYSYPQPAPAHPPGYPPYLGGF
ncbi:uncharacterized protein Tdg isoform X1 [Tribolium castaneum]|uniref:G/T mismatch-specific thymine DNA glycosylase n=1 Tax=Tribolium castaneum TaxID=7070 RepID=D7EL51_TRICA|nr:PREDICTED: uncharacterized protein LOC658765 isoform X1 [Tribolium castaneum]EFA11876.2 hypothetical protein TcasGA2_TC004290 [Tribolium castaneum]|eukprot:XP_970220.2 PREDICTED: uncharacterized protein LOC658765 isoform X1 [Tribolium castaneum]